MTQLKDGRNQHVGDFGISRSSAYSLRSQFGILSCLYNLAGFSWPSALYTLA